MKSKLIHEHHGEKTFALIFDTGDEAMAGLVEFAKLNHLGASQFHGDRRVSRGDAGLLRLGIQGVHEDPGEGAGRGSLAHRRCCLEGR